MIIKELKIDAFGKLENKHISLDDKINVIYGSNESGKSTAAAFIRYMLYGFSGARQTSRASPRLNIRRRAHYRRRKHL